MVRNYDREMAERIQALGQTRPRLLLHACCGPCASSVLERLTPHFDTTVLYYNPNTRPEAEFEKRLYWQRYLLEQAPFGRGVELIVPDRDEAAFWTAARGLEAEPEGGARCTECFELRLGRTARAAAERGFDFFATTLTVSPHKNAPLINAVGEKLAGETGVAWLPSDFKKKDGYRRSIELSHEYGLYRQAWCGCGWPETLTTE
jgi:predicted adenine nucleotide alpha hydrolase (AANH) superfamily ATPase